MEIKENKEIRPKCPHCENVIDHLDKVVHGSYEQHNVYCCPRCHKILGIGVSKQ